MTNSLPRPAFKVGDKLRLNKQGVHECASADRLFGQSRSVDEEFEVTQIVLYGDGWVTRSGLLSYYYYRGHITQGWAKSTPTGTPGAYEDGVWECYVEAVQ